MLEIVIPEQELFNEETSEFIYIKEKVIHLEHSLVSISKWESKWQKPFLSKDPKTSEETRDYVRCMTITQNVDPIVYYGLTSDNVNRISEYIESPMTATWFSKEYTQSRSREIVTSELIYYWMISLNIPMECQKWHLNRLLTLIKVCNVKNQDPKKMSTNAIMKNNRAINAARRARLNTKG